MRVMFSLAVGFLSFAVTGALRAQGQVRAFWTGAAVFGIGYFYLLLDARAVGTFSQQSPVLSRALVTQPLLDRLAAARGLDVRSGFGDFKLWDEGIYADADSSGGGLGSPPMGGGMGPPSMGSGMMPGGSGYGGSGFGSAMSGPGPGSPSGMLGGMPVATSWTYASYNHFLIAGHCAFVILIGLAGGVICQRGFGREEQG
jgi:hypothetical protein